MAGINAAMSVLGKDEIIIDRSEGYIGVLIDDLVTKDCCFVRIMPTFDLLKRDTKSVLSQKNDMIMWRIRKSRLKRKFRD